MHDKIERTTKPLANKVAVVTGAGRGIGKAIALAYAEAGAAVCCAARTQAEIAQTAQEILEQGGDAIALQTDVTQMDQVETMLAQSVEHFGGIDILVVNAGVNTDRRAIEKSVPDEWRTTLEINLFGAYYCAKAAIPYLKARGAGKIIMIGSGMGHKGHANSSAYCVSKAGMWMLTRVLAQEVVEYGISVNELIPGPVDTSLSQSDNARQPGVFTGTEWIKRPKDVVPLALFLATQPDIGPSAQSFSLMRRDT